MSDAYNASTPTNNPDEVPPPISGFILNVRDSLEIYRAKAAVWEDWASYSDSDGEEGCALKIVDSLDVHKERLEEKRARKGRGFGMRRMRVGGWIKQARRVLR
jgi:hypothetical protein